MKPPFDLSWRRRALAADAAAIAELASFAIQPLYLFSYYRVGRNHHLCEEVVQETLVHAIRNLAQYDPQRCNNNIFSWLNGLARNQIQRVLAREKGGQSLEALWARMDRDLLEVFAKLEQEPFCDEVLQRQETAEMVNATMSQLPPHHREALEAKYIRGQSTRQIASEAGITEKAAESLLSRAREGFRQAFIALARNLQPEAAIPAGVKLS